MRQLSYFVFTSGEKGIRELDWGVKFASSVLGDHYELDSSYRELLSEFGLSPSLERPDSGVGLLLLPWRASLLVFIFPGFDTMKRLNTVAIACNIPADLAFSFLPFPLNVREVARRIWSANDLPGISQHGAVRPDVLNFPDEAAPDGEYPFVAPSSLMSWPSEERGYLSINYEVRNLDRRSRRELPDEPPPLPPEPPAVRRHVPYKWIAAACVGAVCVGGFLMSTSDTPPEPPVVRETQLKVVTPVVPKVETPNQIVISEVKAVSAGKKPIVSIVSEGKKPDEEPVKDPNVFDVDRARFRDVLKGLYTKSPAPELKSIEGKPVLIFGTTERFFENYRSDIPTIFSRGTDFDKEDFTRKLDGNITFKKDVEEIRITFWEPDERLQKGASFDLWLDIFIDQAIQHFQPINGGE